MIDIKILRENPEVVKEAIKNKGIKNLDFEKLVSTDSKRIQILREVEELRNKRNKISDEISKASQEERQKYLQEASEIKNSLKNLEEGFEKIDSEFRVLFAQVPNIPSENMPVGSGEEDNIILRGWSKTSGIIENPTLSNMYLMEFKE